MQRRPTGRTQTEAMGMQPIAARPGQGPGIRRAPGAVEGIAQQWRSDRRRVDADLMGTPRGNRHLHQTGLRAALQQGEFTARWQGDRVAGLSRTPDLSQQWMGPLPDRCAHQAGFSDGPVGSEGLGQRAIELAAGAGRRGIGCGPGAVAQLGAQPGAHRGATGTHQQA